MICQAIGVPGVLVFSTEEGEGMVPLLDGRFMILHPTNRPVVADFRENKLKFVHPLSEAMQ